MSDDRNVPVGKLARYGLGISIFMIACDGAPESSTSDADTSRGIVCVVTRAGTLACWDDGELIDVGDEPQDLPGELPDILIDDPHDDDD